MNSKTRVLAAAILAAVLIALTGTEGAQANLRSTYQHRYDTVAKRHGTRAPGRNIVRYGMRNGRRASNRQIARSARTLRRMLTVVQAPAAPAPSSTPAPLTAAAERSIAPTAVQATPTGGGGGGCGAGYRGLYQFDCQTWRSVGGSGDPAAASPAEQRRRAAILQGQRGNSPWPVCGAGGKSLDAIAQCESGGNPRAVG